MTTSCYFHHFATSTPSIHINLLSSHSYHVTNPYNQILDVFAKPGFGALLLWGHRNIDLSRLGLNIRNPTAEAPSTEKRALNAQQNNGDRETANDDSTASENV